jgi:tetratricopeptide (TPR) repeat protein
MAELADSVHEEVKAFCAAGDAAAQEGELPHAIAQYEKAWALLPEPRLEWEAATWVLAAIGDAQFLAGNFVAAGTALSEAMHCPGAIGNPFLHLRLGQCQFELGNLTRANDELTRAYMGGGSDLFAAQDPKYFAHLKTILREPVGGW